jgi:hypothetical protein
MKADEVLGPVAGVVADARIMKIMAWRNYEQWVES